MESTEEMIDEWRSCESDAERFKNLKLGQFIERLLDDRRSMEQKHLVAVERWQTISIEVEVLKEMKGASDE